MVAKHNDIGGGKSRRNPEPNLERAAKVRIHKWSRRARAEQLIEARRLRSDEQQYDLLKKRGHKNCREAQKLLRRLIGGAVTEAKALEEGLSKPKSDEQTPVTKKQNNNKKKGKGRKGKR